MAHGRLREAASALLCALEATETPHGSVLVLDDLHAVADARVFEFLDHLLEGLPQNWTLVIASRVEPPLALGRWRARREVAEFDETALGFSRKEVQDLWRHATGQDDPERAGRLHERTQGWAAGLDMLDSDEGAQVIRLIEQFPADIQASSPILAYARGLCAWPHYQHGQVRSLMEHAAAGFDGLERHDDAQRARAMQALAMFFCGQMGEAHRLGQAVRARPMDNETDAIVRTQLALAELADGSPAAAWRALEPLIEEVTASGNVGQVLGMGTQVLTALALAPWNGAAPQEGLDVLRQWVAPGTALASRGSEPCIQFASRP